jgi:hypothetical protein
MFAQGKRNKNLLKKKEEEGMTESNPVMVDKPSPFSEKKLKLPRRSL